MKALTIWQPWATLIMAGAKPYEFRKWPAPQGLVGQRIVIHAGVRKPRLDEVHDLHEALVSEDPHSRGTGLVKQIALDIIRRNHLQSYPLAAGLGTAVIGEPRRVAGLFKGDSDRVSHHVWAWPLSDIEPFATPIPARGLQGFWEWRGET